jgi:hypothetical protein
MYVTIEEINNIIRRKKLSRNNNNIFWKLSNEQMKAIYEQLLNTQYTALEVSSAAVSYSLNLIYDCLNYDARPVSFYKNLPEIFINNPQPITINVLNFGFEDNIEELRVLANFCRDMRLDYCFNIFSKKERTSTHSSIFGKQLILGIDFNSHNVYPDYEKKKIYENGQI